MPAFKLPKFDRHTYVAINNDVVPDAELALANSNPIMMARDCVDGIKMVHKFGASTVIPTTLSPVTTSLTYPTPTVPTALEIVSDSTDDNGTTSPLGSGALSVDVHGLTDWNGTQVIETVTLNGTTPVALTNSFLRVYRMKIAGSGSYANSVTPSHSSVITLQEVGGAITWGVITNAGGFGLGQSEIACFSVPAGQTAFMTHADVLVGTSKTVDVIFYYRGNTDVVTAPFAPMQSKIVMRNLQIGAQVNPVTPYGAFRGPCDIGWMASSSVGTSSVEIDFEVILIND